MGGSRFGGEEGHVETVDGQLGPAQGQCEAVEKGQQYLVISSPVH